MKLKSRPRQNYKCQELGELVRAPFAAFLISCIVSYLVCRYTLVKWTLEYLVVSANSTAMCLNCGYLTKSV